MSSPAVITPQSFFAYAQQGLARARDMGEVAQVLRSVARRGTPADGASFILREGNESHYYDEEAIGPLWKGTRFPLNACIGGWAMYHAETVIVPNIFDDSRIPIAAYGRTFVKALAVVPIGGHAAHAAIGVYWATHHRATDAEVDRLHRLADIADPAIRRFRPDVSKAS